MLIEFCSDDLFPFLDAGSVSYRDEQDHSAQVDAWLGIDTAKVESTLAQGFDREAAKDRGECHWIGLATEALLTPYTEIRQILERLRPPQNSMVVDLGAGYGRMAFVVTKHFPGVSFLGIEVVRERVAEGSAAIERFRESITPSADVSLVQGDMMAADFILPSAEIYFLYDYGSRTAIEKTLSDLRDRSLARPITVVGRGGATRNAIEREHLWLSQVNRPEHFRHFSIYRS